MKIHLKFMLVVLMLVLISVFGIAADHGLQDSTSTVAPDSASIRKSQSVEKATILDWIERHPVLFTLLSATIAAIAAILGAAIGGHFVIKAKNKELKAKEKELQTKLAQAEKDKQTAIQQAEKDKQLAIQQAEAKAMAESKARLKAAQLFEIEEKEQILETEEDRYLDFVITKNEKLTFQGFETTVKAPILLWDVYVPLRANVMGSGMRDMGLAERGEIPDRRDLSIEEAVQLATDKKYNGLIILGDPGAGKTTLLRYFLLCFARKEAAKRLNLEDRLPILLPLRSVAMSKTFIQNTCAQFQDYDLKLSEPFFLDRLEKGRAIVLLDGLDEVADETARKQMCQWIDNARTCFPRCPFIVTSRFAGYRGEVRLPGAYLELHMQDFTKKDIRQFLHSWYTTVEITLHEDNNYWRTEAQKSAEELYNRIASSEAYLKLAINPLMLQLIALVHYDYKTVPDRRVELYEKCTDLLLQKWDEAKGLKTLLSAKEARQVLQPLALWMHSVENRRQAEEQEVLSQITPHIQQVKPGVEPQKFLTSMRDRSGVFVGYGTETYGFQHLSFQEYLTAEEIRNKSKVEILVNHFDESWWREPTLLALGLGNPSVFELFMASFLRSKKSNGGAADFMLRCVKETLVKSEKSIVDVLLNSRFRWQARYNAMLCLEAIGSTIARNAVAKVKADPVPQIARKAQEMLLQWGRLKVEDVAERDAATGWLKRFINPLEDNAEYILIPAGSYTMGELKKKVTIKPFYLAKFPVTNQRYRKFMEYTRHSKPGYWDNKKYNGADQPVIGVSWDDAVAYCDWLTKTGKDKREFRLPSEAEWEWAAGRGERKYPWGNEEPDPNRANYDNKVGQSTPVGSYPAGATPDGLMDMAGNVWEWTASVHESGKDRRVLKGGAYYIGSGSLGCSVRHWVHHLGRNYHFGFRVVCVPPGNLAI